MGYVKTMTGSTTAAAASSEIPISSPEAHARGWTVGGGSLLAMIAAWFALDQLLLLVYLGNFSLLLWLAALAGTISLVLLLRRGGARLGAIPASRLALCMLVALVVLVLGGEGRLFYANPDWQVRDAVLRDMAINPWPFAYLSAGEPTMLRAPIGMYLLPALAWKAAGPAAGDVVLVAQNTLLLGGLLALGSVLFETTRGRCLALLTMLAFGGLDIVGSLLSRKPIIDHLEGWSQGLQYSSTITLAFWVPQHAFVGWLTGLLYLLYRTDRIRLGTFLAVIPLTALWSPLAMIGSLPWAALAGIRSLRSRDLQVADVLVPGLATLLVLPGLAFLGAAGDGVGVRLYHVAPGLYFLCLEIELFPWVIAALAVRARSPFGPSAIGLATAVLVVIPLIQIGWWIDFMMRGGIPSQTVLGLIMADALARTTNWRSPGWHWFIAAMLCLSAVTGIHEVRRALVFPAVGGGTCSFFRAWDRHFGQYPKDSYLAPLARMPHWLVGPNITRVPIADPEYCWSRRWPLPTGV